jgi:hypothetical protein
MKGQWIGEYSGDVEGTLILNIDEVSEQYRGVAYIRPNDDNIPSSVAYFKTKDRNASQVLKAEIYPFDPMTGYQSTWDQVKKHYSGNITHSSESEITINFIESKRKLTISAISKIGTKLKTELIQPEEKNQSKIDGLKLTWTEFKDHVSGMSKSQFIFRGQKEPWRLRTSFHRRGRFRISEFTNVDVKTLHKRLSAITSHFFDLIVPDQNGSFLNLLQHHGYPTPLLDWSYSPYVSAFFAFRDWPIRYDGNGDVRIYIFNNKKWKANFRQVENLDPPFPHLSIMEFIAIDNPRLVPQQAITTVTNLDDIEAYVLKQEQIADMKFLYAIDIPASCREEAMSDLRFMGITAGSMFPGVDGVCEEIREGNFDK